VLRHRLLRPPLRHRPRRPLLVGLTCSGVVASLVVAPGVGGSQAADGQAPGAPGRTSTWVPGDKDGFGTATGTASKVWYTLSRGKLNDVYYRASTHPASATASSS